jgi:hypothetical protein
VVPEMVMVDDLIFKVCALIVAADRIRADAINMVEKRNKKLLFIASAFIVLKVRLLHIDN